MKKYHLRPAAQKLLLLVSVLAALCLFLIPSKTVILLEAAIFAVAAFHTFLNWKEPAVQQEVKTGAVLLAAAFDIIGILSFHGSWTASSILIAVAGGLHLPVNILVLGIGIVGGIAGFYAFYRLARWMVTRLEAQFSWLANGNAAENLKKNWLLPLSAAAFFLMEGSPSSTYYYSAVCAIILSGILFSTLGPVWEAGKEGHWGRRLLSSLSALGICCFRQAGFRNVSTLMSILFAAVAFPFVYVCVDGFFRKLLGIFKTNKVLEGLKKGELILYGILFLAVLVFVTFAFLSSDAFYGTEHRYDIIYTSDSPMLVQDNAYLSLSYGENDLRQPLFAVFAAPFMGIPYLLSRVLSVPPALNALLMNYIQIAVLFLANFLLCKMLGLSAGKRMCFMGILSLTYTNLLFVLMMEQYIFAYFYLILFLLSVCRKNAERMALWGAGGTLLTSVILLPLLSYKHPVRDFKVWFREMLDRAMEFVVVMIAFCRLDVILGIASNFDVLNQFTGKSLTLFDKLCQFTAFIPSCFLAPTAGIAENMDGVLSWQLAPAASISWLGVGIALIALGSAVLNWNKTSSRLAGGWILFSFLMLFGLGWGTQENGLILYALYFGWAYLALLFQLAEKIGDMLNVKFIVPAATAGAVLVLAVRNIPAIGELLRFAVSHFPL